MKNKFSIGQEVYFMKLPELSISKGIIQNIFACKKENSKSMINYKIQDKFGNSLDLPEQKVFNNAKECFDDFKSCDICGGTLTNGFMPVITKKGKQISCLDCFMKHKLKVDKDTKDKAEEFFKKYCNGLIGFDWMKFIADNIKTYDRNIDI